MSRPFARILPALALLAASALGFASLDASQALAKPEPHLTMDILGVPDIVIPSTPPTAAVVLFSDGDGWNQPEQALAAQWAAKGTLVIGLDSPKIIARMDASSRRCVMMIGEIEAISHQIQNHLETPAYAFPTLAGWGLGGTLALAMVPQIEDATIARVLAIDPNAVVPSKRLLCSHAPVRRQGAGFVYDLPRDAEPFGITIAFTNNASPIGVAQALTQQENRRRLVVRRQNGITAAQALLRAVAEPIPSGGDALFDLPLVDLPAEQDVPALRKTLAIFYSGDGGWRDLDKDLAALLRREGLAVVGVDVLRYFWKRQTPEQTAQDLTRIIETYGKDRGFDRVVLIGFSFGADILPAVFNRLPDSVRSKVIRLALLGVSQAADFEVTMSGWMSKKLPDALPIPPELGRIDPHLIQCFYGEEDDSAICRQIQDSGADVIRTTGGHHFDGDYQALARRILHSLPTASKP